MLGALSQEEIDRVLRTQVIGRIGCHAGGRTYIVPITYAYDGECVYGHSNMGEKIRMMRENPDVCFEVDHMENMANWQSIIAWGTYEELWGRDAAKGMEILLARLSPLMTSESAIPGHGRPSPAAGHAAPASGQQAVLYRIRLTQKTGRYEKR